MDVRPREGRSEMTSELSDEQLREMMRHMIEARVFSTRAFNLQRQGRAGTNAPIDGSEALVVGAAQALDPTLDWVLPQYREPVGLGRFGPEVLEQYVLYLFGHPEGGHLPDHVRVWPPQISLATQIPHAVGLAWGMKLQKQTGCALVFFGDGSSSEGDFYEAANFAGVLDAPVILVLVNNGWAISTPTSQQTRAKNFAEKSHAFGIPGVTVDGGDPIAMFEAVSDARTRALAGAGPTLIEAVTYRLGPHTTADDPTRYVPPDEFADALERDPLVRFGAELMRRGIWSDEDRIEAEATADDTMQRAIERAEKTPLSRSEFFEHVFAEPTPRLARQKREFEQLHGIGGGA